MIIDLDLETYSTVDLRKSGVYAYVEDPAFEILMMGHSARAGMAQVAVGEDQIRRVIPSLLRARRLVAHNAGFDRICLGVLESELADPERWIDTMAWAAEAGYPSKLEALAKALGAEEKDSAGTRLINLFSKPYRGRRVLPAEKPDEWAAFVAYCRQDVETLTDVRHRLPEPPKAEQRLWVVDQKINDRGVRMDRELATQAIAAAEDNRARMEARVRQLAGVDNPNSVQQLGAWLGMPSLSADAVEDELAKTMEPDRREVLQIRQELALSAAKKFDAALAGVSADGRLRGQFRFFGAHTGRWSGRGVQLQNLPRAQVDSPEAVILDLQLGLGADPTSLKAVIRPMFLGPLTVVDYSAIEARVIAWLAGEQWSLEAFAAGRDIYVETAERMSTPSRKLTRAQGKVAVLALGFGGGTGALARMGHQGTEEDRQVLVSLWRHANEKIVTFWKTLEQAFYSGGTAGPLRVEIDGRDRAVVLPSGRAIHYRDVRRYDGELSFASPRGRSKLWYGILVENAVQAVARDLLADALLRMGHLAVVGHVHDEVLVEGDHTVEEIEQIMTRVPTWAPGLPLDAEGFRTDRYRKG